MNMFAHLSYLLTLYVQMLDQQVAAIEESKRQEAALKASMQQLRVRLYSVTYPIFITLIA